MKHRRPAPSPWRRRIIGGFSGYLLGLVIMLLAAILGYLQMTYS